VTDPVSLLRQLYAMRLLIEGLIGELEAHAPPDEDEAHAPDGCPHPEAQQVDASVMGGPPMVLCLACGAQRAGTAPGKG
jgi:hypothetical protein